MFEKIKDIWRSVRCTVFDKGTIKNAIGADVAMSSEMASVIQLWSDMYTDGGMLSLPAAIAREMARTISIEMKSQITGGKRAEFLNEKYTEVVADIRAPLEYGCAKGGLIFKPYVKDGNIAVDYIHADAFFPLAFNDSGKITAAVFAERIVKGSRYYTRLERHELKGTTYTISNKAYMSLNKSSLGNTVSLNSVNEWSALAEEISLANIKKPLFGYFKPSIANTIDTKSPLGVSVYADAVGLIKEAEKQFERLLWEFESGERALIANSLAFKHDKDGKLRLPNKKLYRTLDVDDVDFFKEWSPTLRGECIDKGLDTILRKIEFNCGLAYGTLSNAQNVDKTAEEIKASKQRSYATVSDNQRALKNALEDLIYAMDVWCTLYNLAPLSKWEISFEFDDSIIADRKTEFTEKQMLVTAGIMSKWEFRMWYFGEDEATAKAKVAAEFEGVPEV